MPNKPKERACVNCGKSFVYTPRSVSEFEGPRLYCGRGCALKFQRAQRQNRLTPEQQANLAAASHKPSNNTMLMTPINAEGQRLRLQYLKGEDHGRR